MKTLVRPIVKLNTDVYLSQSYRQNRLKSNSLQYKNFHKKWKIVLITMSFFTFFTFSDSPEINGNICNKFNNEQACSIW